MGYNIFAPQFNRVKGISDIRRFPRMGKIRMGVKKVSQKTGKEYPCETDFFVCPLEVQGIFGNKPKELEIMFPINDQSVVFPQAYTFYGKSKGVKCKGNGEIAMERNDTNGAWIERQCPCERLDKECSLRGHLLFMIPRVSIGGVYQLDTGSYNSTVDINSGFDYLNALIGRFAMIDLSLKRVPRETHGAGSKQIHYTLQLELKASRESLSEIRGDTNRIILATAGNVLPPVLDENPELDEEAVIIEEENGREVTPPTTQKPPLNPMENIADFKSLQKDDQIETIQAMMRIKSYKQESLKKPLDKFADKQMIDFYNHLKTLKDKAPEPAHTEEPSEDDNILFER